MSEAQAPRVDGFADGEFVAAGGHGDVWRYRQLSPGRDVAIKFAVPTGTPRPQAIDSDANRANWSLRRAADALAALSGQPAVVDLYQSRIDRDGGGYLALQWCPSDLARAAKRRFALPEVLEIGIRLAGALESAHQLGIVHRELTPGHVLLSSYGRPALTGFGARPATSPPESARPWAAPETLTDSPSAGAASDVYSLAAVLDWLLAASDDAAEGETDRDKTGRGRTDRAGVNAWTAGRGIARADVPASLAAALRAALSSEPQRRHRTMAAFASDLLAVQRQLALPATDLELLTGAGRNTDGRPQSAAGGLRITRRPSAAVGRDDSAAGAGAVDDSSGTATRLGRTARRLAGLPALARRRVALGVCAVVAVGALGAGVWWLNAERQHSAAPRALAVVAPTGLPTATLTAEQPTDAVPGGPGTAPSPADAVSGEPAPAPSTPSPVSSPPVPSIWWSADVLELGGILTPDPKRVAIVAGLDTDELDVAVSEQLPTPRAPALRHKVGGRIGVTWQVPGARIGDRYLMADGLDGYILLDVPSYEGEWGTSSCATLYTFRRTSLTTGEVSRAGSTICDRT